MILKDVIEKTTEHFRKKGFSSSRLDADLIIAGALSIRRIELYLNYEKPLSEAELTKCRAWVKRRSEGEPVAYILQEKDFYELTFKVGPGVLIPRPETELLVEQAIQFIADRQGPKILDMGSGSGCIPISVLKKRTEAFAVAVEKSKAAFEYLLENAGKLGVQDRLQTLNSDVVELNLTEKFDIVTANPPYISLDSEDIAKDVKRYEPSEALFGGKAGFEAIEAWSKVATNHVAEDGVILFEIGFDQGAKAKEIFESLGFNTTVLKDYSGHDRIVRATKNK